MFSIVIPLFNEEKNIVNLINEIRDKLFKYNNYEIILVNDASTDSTLKVIKNIKKENILILDNIINKGQSFSIKEGIKFSSNETIVTLDGDGQNDPGDINKLLNIYINNPDIKMVGGIRSKRKDSIIKVISSKLANYFRSRILNDGCKDTGCSLKVFNKNIFLEFPYFDGIHRFLPALFKGFGYKTFFVEVNHRKREFGVSKYGTLNRFFKGIRDIIKVNSIIKKRL